MNSRFWIALPLAAALAIPAMAQQNSPTQNPDPTPAASQSMQQSAQPAAPPSQAQSTSDQTDQNLSARQPLTQETHEGFWGKINPFARKKYVQRQLTPIRGRVNELDELTAQNAKNIKDVDARAQQGIQMAMSKANEADTHAVDAGNRAQQAQQTATEASGRIQTVQQVVTNLDQYKAVTQTEIRFRPGQTLLSRKAKDALDDMAKGLKDQKGYILEVQGFSAGRGQAAIEQSQRMAEAVRRYLVINNEVPVYRVHVLGMGNTRVASTEGTQPRRIRGAMVEVSLMKNDLEQLANAQPIGGAAASSSTSTQGGLSGTATTTPAQPATTQPATPQQPSSNISAPATSSPTPNAAPATNPPTSEPQKPQTIPPQQ